MLHDSYILRIKKNIQRRPLMFFWAMAGVFFIFYSILAILRHRLFISTTLDLGNYIQVVWNTAHGNWFNISTVPRADSYLGDHFSPILIIPTIIYRLLPFTETLLIFQTAVVAVSGYLVYQLARSNKLSANQSLTLSAIYFLFPALGFILTFDAHAAVLAIPLGFLALLFFQKRKLTLSIIFFVLLLLVKEEIALGVAAFGLVNIFKKQNRSFGISLFIFSISWFLLTVLYIIPHFAGGNSYQYASQYGQLGGSIKEIAFTILTQPWRPLQIIFSLPKLLYLTALFLPLLFIPVVTNRWAWPALIALLPLLLNDQTNLTTINYHHASVAVAFIFFSLIAFVSNLSLKSPIYTGKIAGSILIFEILIVFFLLGLNFAPDKYCKTHFCFRRYTQPRISTMQEAVSAVPDSAPVSASNNLGPHLAERRILRLYPYLDGAEYIIVDKQNLGRWRWREWETNTFNKLLDSSKFETIYSKDDIYIFHKN